MIPRPLTKSLITQTKPSALLLVLNNASLLLFALVLVIFAAQAPTFFTGNNLLNILIQSSSTVIVATGMTFVLLTAGVDLSVGAAMFVGAAVCGKLLLGGSPLPAALAAMLGVGIMFGAVNAVLITRLRIVAFIVTLAMLFAGRGFALRITETRAMNLPDVLLQLGAAKIIGVPVPVLVFALVAVAAQIILSCTSFGRQLYALGNNAEAARKAGVHVRRLTASVYLISGFCATLGGIITLTQLGAVGPKFGENYEFKAIAAAVLGGTSLFGGRGKVLPGTVLGAVLIQCVENGLVLLDADPYLYPLITSAVIFFAVLIDSTRNQMLARLSRRRIRHEDLPARGNDPASTRA
ncbi:MAG TPA: ABC transporter permease [Candidatus Acidoferrum sp.]|nr:ABC transporter permease [Candidatus Acidoferrum sp.]